MTTPENSPDAVASTSGVQQQLSATELLPAFFVVECADRTQWKIARWILLAAFISGLLLMIPAMFAGPLVLDENGTFWILGHENPLTIWQRSLNYENVPPLSPWLRGLCFYALGESEFAFRLPSIVWYLLAILASWLLGRELLGPVPGALCAFIVAWHPNALGEVRIARCYSLTYCLAAFLFWVTIRWTKSPERKRLAFAWALLGAALMWSHYLNLAVVTASLIVLVWELRIESMKSRSLLAASSLLWIASIIPLWQPLLRMSIWGESFAYQDEAPILSVISPMWWLAFPCAWIVGRVVSFASRRNAVFRSRHTTSILRLLIFWGLIPGIAAAIVCQGGLASLANPRYRIAFEIGSACLAAALLSNRRTASASIISVLVLLLIAWSANDKLPWQMKRLGTPQAQQWKDCALYVQAKGVEGEPIYVQSGLGESYLIPQFFDDDVLLDYAGCRMGRFYIKTPHPRIGLPFIWNAEADMIDHYRQRLDQQRIKGPAALWVASATDTDLNRTSLKGFQILLQQQDFEELETIQYPDVVLQRFGVRLAGD